MDTIFTVKNEHLARLSPVEAVDFFRELLWAEASSIGIGKNLINVPSAITVSDGGVDAEVRDVEVAGGQGIIKPGLTRYQIKTGGFNVSTDADIRSILFKQNGTELKPKVKSCLDKAGTLVVVLFGWDNPEAKDQVVERIRNILKTVDAKYATARMEIWRQNNLIGFLKPFPSLALVLTGRGALPFQTHPSWSQEAEMRREFKAGEEQERLLLSLQEALRKDGEAVHIRVWGEPGIGKTRLVLEATRAADLQPLVLYCDDPSKVRDSPLMNEILRDDNRFSVLLVVDECDPDNRSTIWNKLKYLGSRVKLVSIFNEYDDTSGNISYFTPPQLSKENISKIIQEYGILKDQADRWADVCSGSPRVAHVIAQNLINNPEDLLKSPDTVNVWDRYIVGSDDPSSVGVQQRRLVLRHIALFKRFGFGHPLVAEAQSVWKIIEQADPQITWAKFQEIIADLKARKILQGENTLYITPKALHIKLWLEWWETYGGSFDLDEFSENLSGALLEWFYEMFKYAAESEAASRVVKELLGENGPFKNADYLKTKLGAGFFLALTEADPSSAARCLKATVGTWGKDKLLEFTTGRREVVWALEKIAIWKDLFADAARLLLALGEAENETWSNNASGVFAELFSPGYGSVAPTEASPQERLPVLEEALNSGSKERRVLALKACDQGLETQGFTRRVGAEYQGLRKEPELWMPKTYGELFDAYSKVWQLLSKRLDSLPQDEQQQGAEILVRHARGLTRIQNLSDMVVNTITELAQKPYADRKKILAGIVQIIHYDGSKLPIEVRQRWENLRDALTGSDFQSLMRRYVAMSLLEDQFDEKGQQINQAKPRIEQLAQQTVGNEDLLLPELDWLVTTEAENGYSFGYELGKTDKDFSFLPMILEAQRSATENASVYFLGGYLRAVFEKNSKLWESTLDELAKDEKLGSWIPELTWRSGMSDQAALRILNLADREIVGVDHFRMFSYGSVIGNLSEDIFEKWIRYLLRSSEAHGAPIALQLFYFYYIHGDSKRVLPEELTFKLLIHESFFQKRGDVRREQMEEHYWKEVGDKFVEAYPERSLALADKLFEHFGEDGTILESYHTQTLSVLDKIVARHPLEIWERVAKHLSPPMDSRAFHITRWLQGGKFFEDKEGALRTIPPEKIWEWVDQDVESRAWYLATFVPKTLFREEGRVCLARELLVRYGNRDDVRRNLRANFSSEGWTGPESLHYENKKRWLLDFKAQEDNKNVNLWIDEYVSGLDKHIKQAKIEEEREDF